MSIYIVTGGAGFIGSHLTDALLAAGHTVRVIDDLSTGKRANVAGQATLIQADICDAEVLAASVEGAAGIFHLAAIASVARANEDWAGTHRVNQTGTIAVLEAARAAHLPVVYASSAAVYGDVGDAAAVETMQPRPQTAYGADKLGSELHAAVGWGVHGVPTFGLRFFNVYGPRQDPHSPYSGVISIFASRIAASARITIHGDGGQTRDFIYVADVVVALQAAMAALVERPGAFVSNVCTGHETSVVALAAILGRVCGKPPAISHGSARSGDIRRSVGNAARASDLLGFSARVALEDGLRQTVST